MRPAYFIYPTEEDFIGSVRVFAALYNVLSNDNKMALAWVITTTIATPRICALVASKEVLEESKGRTEQVSPPGIFLIPQPFAEDLRDFPPRIYNSTGESTEVPSRLRLR